MSNPTHDLSDGAGKAYGPNACGSYDTIIITPSDLGQSKRDTFKLMPLKEYIATETAMLLAAAETKDENQGITLDELTVVMKERYPALALSTIKFSLGHALYAKSEVAK